ncbi:GNAT family N-acetyltransferase [Hymenobacter sp. BT175]|uniref:GNAT family N-acetyltransferase n=1 Tax=Hymenobacter translucens TaxID=2886507 RepID=UPI001D0E782E|nr:GNAT family protein [Hymenobacter translucens]MCC2546726.1 GNAT family N-acetyltransferase [Hymenobacter translucens]
MLTLNFTPFPVLTTPRLMLRQMVPADAEDLFAMRSDPQVMQYIPRPLATSVKDAAEHIEMMAGLIAKNELLNWGMALRDTNQLVGTIGFFRLQPEHFRADVGYMLNPRWQGQGLMQEAVGAALDYGFQTLRLHSVAAIIDPRNGASARVLERSGFVREGYFRENEFFNGQFLDTVYYSLLESGRS